MFSLYVVVSHLVNSSPVTHSTIRDKQFLPVPDKVVKKKLAKKANSPRTIAPAIKDLKMLQQLRPLKLLFYSSFLLDRKLRACHSTVLFWLQRIWQCCRRCTLFCSRERNWACAEHSRWILWAFRFNWHLSRAQSVQYSDQAAIISNTFLGIRPHFKHLLSREFLRIALLPPNNSAQAHPASQTNSNVCVCICRFRLINLHTKWLHLAFHQVASDNGVHRAQFSAFSPSRTHASPRRRL